MTNIFITLQYNMQCIWVFLSILRKLIEFKVCLKSQRKSKTPCSTNRIIRYKRNSLQNPLRVCLCRGPFLQKWEATGRRIFRRRPHVFGCSEDSLLQIFKRHCWGLGFCKRRVLVSRSYMVRFQLPRRFPLTWHCTNSP